MAELTPEDVERLRRSLAMLAPGAASGLSKEQASELARELQRLQGLLEQARKRLRIPWQDSTVAEVQPSSIHAGTLSTVGDVSAEIRWGIWRAHGRRCAYTSEPVAFSDVEIDHILPRSLRQHPVEFERVRRDLGLPEDFDLDGVRNLLPTKGLANRQKSAALFDEGTARFFLDRAKRLAPSATAFATQLRRRWQTEDLLLPVQAAVEEGVVSKDEAVEFITGTSEQERFELVAEIMIGDRRLTGLVTSDDAAGLASTPIGGSPGAGPFGDPLELVNDNDEKRMVNTCEELRRARADGFYALTTLAMKHETVFNQICGVVSALRRARAPEVSYLDRPRVGVVDLRFLPVELLSSIDPDTRDLVDDSSLRKESVDDWLAQGRVTLRGVSSHSVRLEYSTGLLLAELMRGDFDGDGVEEILLSSYTYAIGGSFGYGDVLLLGRDGPAEMFTIGRLSESQ